MSSDMTLRESTIFYKWIFKKIWRLYQFHFHIVNSFNFITHFTTSENKFHLFIFFSSLPFSFEYEKMPYQICYVIMWSKNGYKDYWVIFKVGSITVQKYHVLSDIHVHVTSGRQSAGCPICLCNLTYKTTLCQTCFL